MEKKLDCLAGNLATLFGKTFFFFLKTFVVVIDFLY